MSRGGAPRIKLVSVRPRYDTQAGSGSGSPLALSDYTFEVNDKEVTVAVEDAAVSFDGGQLSPGDVEKAARALIEDKLEKGWEPCHGEKLVLDEKAMKRVVAPRIGWSDRFKP